MTPLASRSPSERPRLVLAVVALAAAAASLVSFAASAATDKRVAGIITSVEPASVCITTLHGDKVVSGRIDPARTKVIVDGHAASAGDLRVTYTARADLALDDVWLAIQANTR